MNGDGGAAFDGVLLKSLTITNLRSFCDSLVGGVTIR